MEWKQRLLSLLYKIQKKTVVMKQIIVMAMTMNSHFFVHTKAGRHVGFILSMQISKQNETQ